METHKKMKKINPRIISIAMILLSLLFAGGFAAKEIISQSGGGTTGAIGEEINPNGG